MNSEWGVLGRGSDPPYGHRVNKMASDMWRALARRVIEEHLVAGVQKKGVCFQDTTGKLSPRKPRIDVIPSGPSSTSVGLAR